MTRYELTAGFLIAVVLLLTTCPALGEDAPRPGGPEIDRTTTGHPAPPSAQTLNELIHHIEVRLRDTRISIDELQKLQKFRAFLLAQKSEARRTPKEKNLLEKVEAELKERAAKDRDAFSFRALAIYYLLKGSPEDSLAYLRKALPKAPKDIGLPLLMAYAYHLLGDYERLAKEVERTQFLVGDRFPLRLREPLFASSVSGYRLFTPIEDALKAGSDVLIYTEIEGARFQEIEKDIYECHLAIGLTLYDRFMNEIWSEPDYGVLKIAYRGPVRDLHASIRYRLPNTLAAGRYHLIVHCRDRYSSTTNTTAQKGFHFDIASGAVTPSAPATRGDGGTASPATPTAPTPEVTPELIQKELQKFADEEKRMDAERLRMQRERDLSKFLDSD